MSINAQVQGAFDRLPIDDRQRKVSADIATRYDPYIICKRLKELLRLQDPHSVQWVRDLRMRLSFESYAVKVRTVWRQQLLAFGIKDSGWDIEELITWKPGNYWYRQRDEELRRFDAQGFGQKKTRSRRT